jgi:hypothetical protein
VPVVHVANHLVQARLAGGAPLTVADGRATVSHRRAAVLSQPAGRRSRAGRVRPERELPGRRVLRRWASPAAALAATTAPSVASLDLVWHRVGPWLPWMGQGDRPGYLLYRATGRKVGGLDELPGFFAAELERLPRFRARADLRRRRAQRHLVDLLRRAPAARAGRSRRVSRHRAAARPRDHAVTGAPAYAPRMRHAALSLLIVTACGGSPPRPAGPEPQSGPDLSPALAPVRWMVGDWEHPGGREHWVATAGVFYGVGFLTDGGFEAMVIDDAPADAEGKPDGVLRLFAMPGGAAETVFTAAAADPDALRFANPQHDDPQVIAYARRSPDGQWAATVGRARIVDHARVTWRGSYLTIR